MAAILHVAECETDGATEDHPRSGLAAGSRATVLEAIEELARHARPGSLLVSGAAAPFLDNRLGLWKASSGPDGLSGSFGGSILVCPVARRPSIAVMPLRDVTAGPDACSLADGIGAGIVAALSRFRWLSVVASESTSVYRTRRVDPRVVGAELGVRYLLTGVVEAADDRIRARVELVDADQGAVLWSEGFDHPPGDIFDMQDRIGARIAATSEMRLHQAEVTRVLRKRPDSLDAYECVLRFHALVHRFTDGDHRAAGELLGRAIALDPNYAVAHAWRAWWHLTRVYQGWSDSPDTDRAEASRMAALARELDPEDPVALALCGHTVSLGLHDYDAALAYFERALALNPSLALAWGLSSATFCYIGEPRVALDRAAYALKLSPFDPFAFFFTGAIGFAHMLLDEHEEALGWLHRARVLNPRFSATLRVLAACLAHLGRLRDAREVAREFRAIEQHFDLEAFRLRWALRDPVALEAHVNDLRLAGLADERPAGDSHGR